MSLATIKLCGEIMHGYGYADVKYEEFYCGYRGVIAKQSWLLMNSVTGLGSVFSMSTFDFYARLGF